MRSSSLILLSVVALTHSVNPQASDQNPVAAVVALLRTTIEKLNAEQDAENTIWDKYFCWANETTTKYSGLIEENLVTINATESEIDALNGNIARNEKVDIVQTNMDINSTRIKLANAIEKRKQRNADALQQQVEIANILSVLEQAILKLQYKGSEPKGTLLQKRVKLVSLKHLSLPGSIKSFLQELDAAENPATLLETKGPASGAIQGVMKDMYASFASDLEDSTATELKQQATFERLKRSLEEQLDSLRKLLASQESQLAEDKKALANAQQLLEETQEALEKHREIVRSTKEKFRVKENDYGGRKSLRQQELSALQEAVDILDSPEMRQMFTRAATGTNPMHDSAVARAAPPPAPTAAPAPAAFLLQLSSKRLSAVDRVIEAMHKTHSLRLAEAAMALLQVEQTPTDGSVTNFSVPPSSAFHKVLRQISQLIEDVDAEEQEDNVKLDECTIALHELDKQHAETSHNIKKSETQEEYQTSYKQEKERKMAANLKDQEEARNAFAQLTTVRESEKATYAQQILDDQQAIEAINRAIVVLEAFYGNNAIPLVPETRLLLLRKTGPTPPPTFEKSNDYDEEHTWRSPVKGHSTNVIQLLKVIRDNFQRQLTKGQQQEATSNAEFLNAKEQFNSTVTILQRQHEKLNQQVDEHSTKIDSELDRQQNENSILLQLTDQLDAEHKRCDWFMNTGYQERKEARAKEKEGLFEAQKFLASYGPESERAKANLENVAEDATAELYQRRSIRLHRS